jgi:hypothetical protein
MRRYVRELEPPTYARYMLIRLKLRLLQVFSSKQGMYYCAQKPQEKEVAQHQQHASHKLNPRKTMLTKPCSHTTQLEQKIESLVNLLSAAQGGVLAKLDYLTPPGNEDQYEPTASTHSGPDSARPTQISWAAPPLIGVQSKTSWSPDMPLHPAVQPSVVKPGKHPRPSSVDENINLVSKNIVSDGQQERLLNVFRERYSPHWPFIIIPSGLTANQLQNQKPWLHKTILMIASFEDRVHQLEVAKEIVLGISSAMLIRGDKNMDMLQSLILYNGTDSLSWPLFSQRISLSFLSV